MGKKPKKGKSRAKAQSSATGTRRPQTEHTKASVAPAARSTPTYQPQVDENEPTETEIMAIMHDDDLLEYSSSSPSSLRRSSIFEFYKQQLKAIRAQEQRSKKAEALRNAPNLASETSPETQERSRLVNSVVTHLKAGLQWCASNLWLWPAVLISSPLLYGIGVGAMYGQQPMIAACLYLLAIGLIVVKAITEARTHEKRIGVIAVIIFFGTTLFGTSLFWIRHTTPDWLRSSVTDTKTTESLPAPLIFSSPTPTPDLRSELRADGNRAIRLVTIRLALRRKYSIDEIGHFRVMYEVAAITNKIIPEFYLACQDYYGVNTFVDPKAKQFGYRWTVQHRRPNGTYGPIASFSKGRGYGATTGLVPTTDDLEFSVDLYDQVPADKILEDLFGKYLYIFVTESLADKISEVSFRVNNWEFFSVKADRLIFPDDKPLAPWFIALSQKEQAIHWKSVNVRYDEPLPSAVAETFNGQNPGWTWSLDPGSLHPKKLPEPELKIDPFKPN